MLILKGDGLPQACGAVRERQLFLRHVCLVRPRFNINVESLNALRRHDRRKVERISTVALGRDGVELELIVSTREPTNTSSPGDPCPACRWAASSHAAFSCRRLARDDNFLIEVRNEPS
jgi:hypothetical protein